MMLRRETKRKERETREISPPSRNRRVLFLLPNPSPLLSNQKEHRGCAEDVLELFRREDWHLLETGERERVEREGSFELGED